jgi:ABC-type dipeptide/oligopeptide/nickel transport system permease component
VTTTDNKDEPTIRAQFILGAVSLVIWFIVAFTLGVLWYVDEDTAQPILMAGGIALMIAAVPWLWYRPLVRKLSR